jgi:hypothetical protein
MVCGLVSAESGVSRHASISKTIKSPSAMIFAKRRRRRAGGRSPTKDLANSGAAIGRSGSPNSSSAVMWPDAA